MPTLHLNPYQRALVFYSSGFHFSLHLLFLIFFFIFHLCSGACLAILLAFIFSVSLYHFAYALSLYRLNLYISLFSLWCLCECVCVYEYTYHMNILLWNTKLFNDVPHPFERFQCMASYDSQKNKNIVMPMLDDHLLFVNNMECDDGDFIHLRTTPHHVRWWKNNSDPFIDV